MNQFSQRVITIGVVIMATCSVLSYVKINSISNQMDTIIELDYQDTGNNAVLDNIDLNIIRIFDKVYDIRLTNS